MDKNIETLIRKKQARDVNKIHRNKMTRGEKFSKKFSNFIGSWRFIIVFLIIVIAWFLVNASYFIFKPYDPYPYLFLNLVLACIAAIQAPIILMSQNRQDKRDQIKLDQDYKINRKTEILIEHIIKKLNNIEQNIENHKKK